MDRDVYEHTAWEESHGYGGTGHIELTSEDVAAARTLVVLGRDALLGTLADKYVSYDEAAEAGEADFLLLWRAHELEVFHMALVLSSDEVRNQVPAA